MAYFRRVRDADVQRVSSVAVHDFDLMYCDDCAHGPGWPENPNGKVPFRLSSGTFGGCQQERPWCWSPHVDGTCAECGCEIKCRQPEIEESGP